MSQRASITAVALSLAALLAVTPAFGAAARAADYPSLHVFFHPNNTVTVVDDSGAPVGTSSGAPTVIPPGTYNILIDDSPYVADIEWNLAGPGVKLVTSCSYGEEPSETWVETFTASSSYTWRDDNRPPTVWSFDTSSTPAVGSANSGSSVGLSTTPISSGKSGKASSTDVVGSDRPLGTLLGSVTSTGKAALTDNGKPVSTLKAGRYTFKVTDRSKTAGFTVQQNKRVATTVTGALYTGTRSKTLTLTAGQWFFYSSFVGKKTYFIVIA